MKIQNSFANLKREPNCNRSLFRVLQDPTMTGRKYPGAEFVGASLSDLESKLRSAYMQKHLKAQIAHNKAQQMSDQLQSRIADDLMMMSVLSADETVRKIKQQNLNQTQQYKQDLKSQILDKQKQQSIEKCQQQLDRQILIEVDRAREENEQLDQIRDKFRRMDIAKRQNLIQQEMKEVIRSKNSELEAEEDASNLRYLIDLEERNRRIERAEEERMVARQAAIDSLARALTDQTAGIEERRELLSEIVAEEMKQEALKQALMDELHKRKTMRDLTSELRKQMEMKARLRRQLELQEATFLEDAMSQVMKSEFLARQTDLARKRKQIEYKEELKRLIRERQRLREHELEQLFAIMEKQRLEQLKIEENVKEERKKLLMEHSMIVGDFVSCSGLTEEEKLIVSEMKNKK